MLTPIRHGMLGQDSISGGDSNDEILILRRADDVVAVDHDGFTIGSSSQCDLIVIDAGLSLLHAVIHIQSGATWIEAASEESLIQINGRPCRRISLRNDDLIQLGSAEFIVKFEPRTAIASTQSQGAIEEDLSLLTAEELCDRIIAEQTMVDEFDEGRKAGWDALVKAIEAAHTEDLQEELIDDLMGQVESPADVDQEQIENLLSQIQQLNQTITDRNQELSEREKEVLESAKLLDQQIDIAQRLEQVLEQLDNNDPPSELRASA